jgi:CHAT domain-containing protein
MKKGNNTFYKVLRSKYVIARGHYPFFTPASLCLLLLICLGGCDFFRVRDENTSSDQVRQPVGRVNSAYLYKDELVGIVPAGTSKEDSTTRVESYVNSWVRKQLLIQEAAKKMNINEAEVERKMLDYKYSIIAYEYQTEYVKRNLDTLIAPGEIEQYYKDHIDNFILKQNIVQATFIKVPKNAPKTTKIKDLIFSHREKDEKELKSYCLSFSAAYHISDSTWMVFDELVGNSPLAEIPNKIQFLKSNPYYETSDEMYLYFFKTDQYRISDNVSPLEFVKDEIKNIILNKRKVELANKLEDEVYTRGVDQEEFEIYK